MRFSENSKILLFISYKGCKAIFLCKKQTKHFKVILFSSQNVNLGCVKKCGFKIFQESALQEEKIK